jgi:hypothetical protein
MSKKLYPIASLPQITLICGFLCIPASAQFRTENGLSGGIYVPSAQMPITGSFQLWISSEKAAWNPDANKTLWAQRFGWSGVPIFGLEVAQVTQWNILSGKDQLWPRLSVKKVHALDQDQNVTFAWGFTDLQKIEAIYKKSFFVAGFNFPFENGSLFSEIGGSFLLRSTRDSLSQQPFQRIPLALARITWNEGHWTSQMEAHKWRQGSVFSLAGLWHSKTVEDTTQKVDFSIGLRYTPDLIAEGKQPQIGLTSHLTIYPYANIEKNNDGLNTEPILQITAKPFWQFSTQESSIYKRAGLQTQMILPLVPEKLKAITRLEFADTANAFEEPSHSLWRSSYLQWDWLHSTWMDHNMMAPTLFAGAFSPEQLGLIWSQNLYWQWWSAPQFELGILSQKGDLAPYFNTHFALYPQLSSWASGTRTDISASLDRQQQFYYGLKHHQNFGKKVSFDLSGGMRGGTLEARAYLNINFSQNWSYTNGKIGIQFDPNLPIGANWNQKLGIDNRQNMDFSDFKYQTPIDWILQNKSELYRRKINKVQTDSLAKTDVPKFYIVPKVVQEAPIDVQALLKEYEHVESRDQDKDSFLDDQDNCPTVKEDFNSFEDNDGCPDESILQILNGK